MGSELAASEKSWLEIVKAASNAEQFEADEEEVRVYPNVIEPSWIGNRKEHTGKRYLRGGTAELLTALPLSKDSPQGNDSLPSPSKTGDPNFVRELKQALDSNGLSEQGFLRRLGLHLENLKGGSGGSLGADKTSSSGFPGNQSTDEVHQERVFALLNARARLLGQRSVSIILECCITLKFWDPVQILLQCRVVVSFSSSKLVQSLTEEEQPFLLCLYVRSIPDVTPQDVHIMLSFFLDSMARPLSCFQLVRSEWRKVAGRKIEKAGKRSRVAAGLKITKAKMVPATAAAEGVTVRPSDGHSGEMAAVTNSNSDREFKTLAKGKGKSAASAIELAVAVDGFSPPELCLHDLLASGQDESVLSSVVSRLNSSQVLKLTQYLIKWMERYSSQLANSPMPNSGRVPSLLQVISWAGVVLEERFTQLVLSADFHEDLKCMSALVRSLVSFSTNISSVGSIAEHIRSQCMLPVPRQQTGAQSRYVVELLDLS